MSEFTTKSRTKWEPELHQAVEKEAKRVSLEVRSYHENHLKRVRDLDFYILDNSIRESTVGQLRSHTLENKIAIFNEVKKCGIQDIIVACFAHMPRVDDCFCKYLKKQGEDFSKLFSFSELSEGMTGGRYDMERIPISCQKNKEYGLGNTIFEIDLANPDCDWDEKWSVEDHCQLLLKRFQWVRAEISQDARMLVNFRDFSTAMSRAPSRVLHIVRFLSSLPAEERIFGLIYEDLGESLPNELGAWTESIRRVTRLCGWEDARLLVHIHEQWDLMTAATIECLERGADGVWASLCEEGAAMGHACSFVTAMNLVRLGNTKILQKYNCMEMRSAARNVTRITTGSGPHPRQALYGDRALDMVFGFPITVARDFDLATFFGVKPIPRITTLASAEMIRDKLISDFGDDPQFTLEIAKAMKAKILEDLQDGRKEEYLSKCGIAMLFDRSGGQLTEAIRDVIAASDVESERHKELIAEVKELWDKWDLCDEVQGDDQLQFDSFYHGFMSPYFGCYRCTTTKQALQALDMDSDGFVDWSEFLVYLKWALGQYPKIETADDLLDTTFQMGLIPAMRDVQINGVTERSVEMGKAELDLVSGIASKVNTTEGRAE